MEDSLSKLFDEVAKYHIENPSMYYFGEGDKKGIELCKESLKLLKKFRNPDYFISAEALPSNPAFKYISRLTKQITIFYTDHEIDLLMLFLFQLLSTRILPFQFNDLKAMEFGSAMVYIQDEKFNPKPLPAHINGFNDFVIPIAESELRIPLIPDDSNIPVALPPSIRFVKSKDSSGKIMGDNSPHTNRRNQLFSFMTVLSRVPPQKGLSEMFRSSLISDDLAFAISIAVLASDSSNLFLTSYLMNLLGIEKKLDHYLRSLSCSVSSLVLGTPSRDSIELTALINSFVIASLSWGCHVEHDGGLTNLLQNICESILTNRLPPLAYYIMRVALTIAAYENPKGNAAIAMFLEVFAYPFAHKFEMIKDLRELKSNILHPIKKDIRPEEELIQNTIIYILAKDICIGFKADDVENQLKQLYEFTVDKADSFVKIVLALNSRQDFDNPVAQSLYFAYRHLTETAQADSINDNAL